MSDSSLEAARPPDPDSLGRIRKIVSSAHKWGGDGTKPIFRKIRRILVSRHADVIAKAFGGNPDVAAAWIKNNWYRQRGRDVPPTRGKGKIHAMADEFFGACVLTDEQEAAILTDGVSDIINMGATKAEKSDDGTIVKTILRTGKWKYWPNGQKKKLDIDKKFLQDVVDAFKAGVVEHVHVPLNSHDDADLTKNTGFVTDVWVEESQRKKGRWLLKARLDITEPEVKGKVERGTYPDVSVFVDMRGVRDAESGKIWPRVLKHVTVTHRPFVSEMNDRKLAAIAGDGVVLTTWDLEPDEDDLSFLSDFEDIIGAKSGDVSWDDKSDWDAIREKVDVALRSPEYRKYPGGDSMPPEANTWLWKMSNNKALIRVKEGWGPENDPRYFVAGWEMSSGSAVVDPPDEWIEVHQRWIQATSQESAWDAVFTEDANPENSRGGNVATENGGTAQPGGGDPSGEQKLTMTQSQFDEFMAQRDKDRDEELKALQAKVAAAEERDKVQAKKLHEKDVASHLAKWESMKLPPAAIIEARAAITPQRSSEDVFAFSVVEKQGDDEVTIETQLNLMEVVDRIMCAIPAAQDGGGSAAPRIAETDASTGSSQRFTAISGGGGTSTKEEKKSVVEDLESDLNIQPTTKSA